MTLIVSLRKQIQLNKLPLIAIGLLIFGRILTLGIPDLIDTSDARYAQIANQMVQDRSYIIPRIEQGRGLEPYWSKPPLAFWLTAASMKTFGIHEWSARLPTALASIFTGILVLIFASRIFSVPTGFVALTIYLSTGSVFFLGGTTMIDPLLTLCVTGFMVCFGLHILSSQKSYIDLLGFLFAGLGILVKGPIALVFPALSLGLYSLVSRDFSYLRRINWMLGIALCLGISVPWFLAAEQQSPGFIRYFLMEENLNRLISKDLKLTSGVGHRTPFAFVWLLFPMMSAPWIFVWVAPAMARVRSWWKVTRQANESQFLSQVLPFFSRATLPPRTITFLLCWMLAPLFMLTIGKQVLGTYVLPCVPAASVLVAVFLVQHLKGKQGKIFFGTIEVLAWVLLGSSIIFIPLYQFYFEGTFLLLESILCLGLFFSYLFFFRKQFSDKKDSLVLFYRVASLMALAFVAIVISSHQLVSQLKSTGLLLSKIESQIAQEVPGQDKGISREIFKPTRVQFLERVPQSAYFYASQNGRLQPERIKAVHLDRVQSGYIVLREKDLALYPKLRDTLSWSGVGKWQFAKVPSSTPSF